MNVIKSCVAYGGEGFVLFYLWYFYKMFILQTFFLYIYDNECLDSSIFIYYLIVVQLTQL